MCDHCVLKLRKEVRRRDTQRRDAAAEAKRERKSLKQQWMHARKKRLLHAKHSIEREVLRLNGAEARRRRAATESSRRGRRGAVRRPPLPPPTTPRSCAARSRRTRSRARRRCRRRSVARRCARHFLSVFKLSDSAGILIYYNGIENSRKTI